MKLIDLSQPIWDGSPNCPTHPPVRVEILADHSQSESQSATSQEPTWHMELVSMASHTGSHLDAPLHKMPNGAAIDAMPLESFVGAAFIADLRFLQPEQEITPAHLQNSLPQVLERGAIVLLATGWGDKRAKTDEWHYRAPFLGAEGARWIVERNVRGVGIDHYSVGGAQEPRNARTHEILLGQGVWIVEELRFPQEVFALPQPHKFWALPINLKAHSGAWCRPVLEILEVE